MKETGNPVQGSSPFQEDVPGPQVSFSPQTHADALTSGKQLCKSLSRTR